MPSMNHIRAVTVGELLVPMLPADYFLNRDNANQEFQEILEYFLENDTIVNRGRTLAGFRAVHNNLNADERGPNWTQIADNITNEQFLNEHGDDYITYLVSTGPTEMHLGSIDIFTTTFLAVAKRVMSPMSVWKKSLKDYLMTFSM